MLTRNVPFLAQNREQQNYTRAAEHVTKLRRLQSSDKQAFQMSRKSEYATVHLQCHLWQFLPWTPWQVAGIFVRNAGQNFCNINARKEKHEFDIHILSYFAFGRLNKGKPKRENFRRKTGG